MKASFFTFFVILVTNFFCLAQQQFVEGIITYTLSIESPTNTTKGTFIITIKGAQIVKELQLGKDFKNVLIFNMNKNTAYSLRKIEGKKYAIQLNAQELRKRQQACEKIVVEPLNSESKIIAGYKAESANVICGSRRSVIYYSKDWTTDNDFLFEQFPAFQYMPLAYSIKNEDGSILHFEMKLIEARPIDNSTFQVPTDYKIISSNEYQQLIH